MKTIGSLTRSRRFWIASIVAFVMTVCAVLIVLRLSIQSLRTESRAPMPEEASVTALPRVCGSPVVHGFCEDTSRIEHDLVHAPMEIVEAHVTSEGATRPERLRVDVTRPGGMVTYHLKWKRVPPDLDQSNHSPRREIASYRIQSLLFAAEHFVVPPTALRCFPLDEVGALSGAAPFPGTRCALGTISYWIEDAYELEERHMEEVGPEFASHLGDLNVFTYVAAHRDGIGQNFLAVGKPAPVRAFAVDNGMTFGAWAFHPLGILAATWADLTVPALRRATIERIRSRSRRDFESLMTVAQLRLDGAGIYRSVTPTPPFDGQRDSGVRRRGSELQLGLSEEEVEDVYERSRELLAEVDQQAIRTI
jgi:hypothetical protein